MSPKALPLDVAEHARRVRLGAAASATFDAVAVGMEITAPPVPDDARTVLGIDASLTATGWCALQFWPDAGWQAPLGWRILDIGVLNPPEAVGKEIGRVAWITDFLVDLVEQATLDFAAVEGYSYGSPQGQTAAFSTGELGGVLRFRFHRREVRLLVIPPSSWRKECYGRGGLKKEDVKVEAFKRFGVEHPSTDALEAFSVAYAAGLRALGLVVEPPPPDPVRSAASKAAAARRKQRLLEEASA